MPAQKQNDDRRRFERVYERVRRADSNFDPEFVVFARKLALLGLSRNEIARNLGADKNTFDAWVADYPEFARALDEGMIIGDFAVVEALHRRCTGYYVRLRQWKGGNETGVNEQYVPPDVAACRWWLINRQPDLWKAEVAIDSGGPTYGDLNARPVEFPLKAPDAANDPDEVEAHATPPGTP